MKLLAVLFLGIVAFGATGIWAACNPQFRFNDAAAAFSAARAPTAQEIVGRWEMTGTCFSDDSQYIGGNGWPTSGYWADGKVTIPGEGGFFNVFFDLSAQGDAFGGQTISLNETLVGVETGKVYQNFAGSMAMTSTGLIDANVGGGANCAETIECRLVDKAHMLLCATTMTDSRRKCANDQPPLLNETYTYTGFVTHQ